ncbi:MarR family winged helix-turn-helix transcriptional regulator [Sulfitobacter dubius]|uniref:MarR family winged helix-turn-helix transcriptional regulator n=1 Tax=Sulfitobacter dubius TaxID=218673 RepID=UPI00267C6AAD
MHQPIDSDTSSFLLLDIARLLRAEFESRVDDAELGITPSEARTLANVARFGPLRQNDLADLTGLGAMSVTSVLDNLEAAGMVRRSVDPKDRRAKLVQVTEKATPLLAKLRAIGNEVRAVTRGDIPADDWQSFRGMLKTARDNHLTAYRNRRTTGAVST